MNRYLTDIEFEHIKAIFLSFENKKMCKNGTFLYPTEDLLIKYLNQQSEYIKDSSLRFSIS